MNFSRKVAVRAVGENTRGDVEGYIESQVASAGFVDAEFAKLLSEIAYKDFNCDLSQATNTAAGSYWYNLHLVLVVDGRVPICDVVLIKDLQESFLLIAAKKGHGVSRLTGMPDHLHAAIRGRPDETPLDIVFAYQNNLAHMLRLGRIWMPSFYVATFGEYSMQAVRASSPSVAPSAQGGTGTGR